MKSWSKNAEHSCIVLCSGETYHIPVQTVHHGSHSKKVSDHYDFRISCPGSFLLLSAWHIQGPVLFFKSYWCHEGSHYSPASGRTFEY